MCQGAIIGCHDGDNGEPSLFDTKEEAWKEIADGMVENLQQFIKGERELDETDFGTEEFVEEVYVTEDGCVISAEIHEGSGGKILFDPKLEENKKS